MLLCNALDTSEHGTEFGTPAWHEGHFERAVDQHSLELSHNAAKLSTGLKGKVHPGNDGRALEGHVEDPLARGRRVGFGEVEPHGVRPGLACTP